MAPADPIPDSLTPDAERHARAKRQLYVVCQMLGWGGFIGFQTLFVLAGPGEWSGGRDPMRIIPTLVMVGALGLLLSHGARALVRRWGWKELGWLKLVPRVAGASAAASLLWSVLGFGWTYGIVREPWTSQYSFPFTFTISWANGSIIYAIWFCIYFFYQLFDRFNRLELERISLIATVKEAELRALKAQVNPHFIFNSLNSVRALIDEDPTRARQAVTQLANLLRYSLQSGQLEKVSFEEELRMVNDYLALEQVRHEERLRLRLDIAPEALRQPVPPMLLQTLVENAVKYGISARPEGGEIGIIARCADDTLQIRVSNPGGLSRAAEGRTPASTGLGLRNASDRLHLLFGERATFTLAEQPAGTVVAEIHLPLDSDVASGLRHAAHQRPRSAGASSRPSPVEGVR